MKKHLSKTLALLLCVMIALTVISAGAVSVFAANDVYANELISFSYNSQCNGFYLTPIATGKYPTFVMIHGGGGISLVQSNLRYFINEWVKAGYFPPMNVVMPKIEDFDGSGDRYLNDFVLYMKRDNMFGTLLENIESGALSPQIDTDGDILVAGFSMGGMAAVECGAEYNTRIKKIGGLSPSQQFYYAEGREDFYYAYKKDIFFSKEPDAFAYMAYGEAEGDGQNIRIYKGAIESNGNNKDGLVVTYKAPSSWGGHAWPLEKKEIFMFLYYNFYGKLPDQSLVESVCDGSRAPTTPAVRSSDSVHPAPETVIAPYAGDKLIDLDMSTYEKDTTTDPAAVDSVGNVTNNGTLSASTKVKMSSKSGTSFGLDLNKKTFTNNKGTETSYLERKVNASTAADNIYTTVDDTALETTANTISFWSNYTPINRQYVEYSMFDYNVTYDGESAPVHLFTVDQATTTESKLILTGRWGTTGRWNYPKYGDVTDEAAGKWAYYTITNPEYELNGKKTVKIYVNGKYLYSKIVTKPEGNVTRAMLTFGGENTPGQYLTWPDTFTLGNVTVYDGVLTPQEIFSEYTLNKDYYIENETGLPFITGYTLSDSSVYYDGETHMINVSARADATEGVTTTYTVNGAAFSGATEVGIYPVTATVSKEGYNDLILNAKLIIKEKYTPPAVSDGDKLIDLDVSTYVKDTATDPNSVTTSIGGVTNNGTLAASTVVKMSSKSGNGNGLNLTKETFENEAGGETAYLHRTVSTPIENNPNVYSMLEENALEATANTITFWAKYVPENRSGCYYNFFDYNATYDGETDAKHLFSLGQEPTTVGQFNLTGRWGPVYADITDEAAGKWAYYVITNPQYVNRTKTMKVYVNGEFKGSKDVSKPEGDLMSTKLSFGGELSPTNILYWPSEFSLGEVCVIGGVMSESDILAAYNRSKNRYTEKEGPFDFNVEFNESDKTFAVSTDSVFKGTNNISLIVLNSEGAVVYMDAKNEYKGDSVSFTVNLGGEPEAGEYTFILASDGDTVLSGTKTFEITDNFGIFGNIAADSLVSAEYTLAEGEAEPLVIIAVYKDGRVNRVNMSKTAKDGKVTAGIEFGASEDVTGYTVKAFAWKDLITLQPIKRERILK